MSQPNLFARQRNNGKNVIPDRVNTGGVNIDNIYRMLMNTGLMPRRPSSLEAIDAGLRNQDYTDLAEDYNDRAIEKYSSHLTAALLNARNSIHLTILSPIFYTDEFNFHIRRGEVLQIPFDRVGPGGLARITGYTTTSRKASLLQYKRAVRHEMTALQDPNFGEAMFEQSLQSIRTQAEMTLCGLVAVSLIDGPYLDRLQRLSDPQRPFSHAREMLLNEDEAFLLGSRDQSALIQKMLSSRNSHNLIDTAVLPGGAMLSVIANASESRPMPAYKLVMQNRLRDYLIYAYEGPNSLRTIPLGDGGVFNITENYGQRISSDDGDEEEMQALRSEVTLAEMAIMPRRPEGQAFSTSQNALDIGLPNHLEGSVTVERITLVNMVQHCLLWYESDGTLKKNPMENLVLGRLVAHYNETRFKNDAIAFFRDERHADNDRVFSDYTQQNLPLSEMKGFREFFGFVEYNDDFDAFTIPRFIGSIEPKTLPPSHLARIAELLVAVGKFDDSEAVATTNIERLHRFISTVLPTSIARPAPSKDFFADFRAFVMDLLMPIGNVPNYPDPDSDSYLYDGKIRSFKAYHGTASLVPKQSETLQDYKKRLTPEVLTAEIQSGRMSPGWTDMFAHASDSAIDPLLSVAFHADHTADNAPATAALDALQTSLATYSKKAHTREIAERAFANIQANNGSVASLVPADNAPWLTTTAEARLNAMASPTANLASVASKAAAPVSNTASFYSNLGRISNAIDDTGHFVTDEFMSVTRTPVLLTQFTWRTYYDYSKTIDSELKKVFYALLLRSTFTYETVMALAAKGAELFRVNVMKLGIHLHVESIALLRAGPDTMSTALGHVIVLTGVDADEGYLTVNAQFHAGVIIYEPAYMDMIPFAIARRYLGGRNNRPIHSVAELLATHSARHARLNVPVPVSETLYSFPTALFGLPAYAAPNTEGIDAYQKGSWVHYLNTFAGDIDEGLTEFANYRDNSSIFETSHLCGTLHRACTWYDNGTGREMNATPGTGPLGSIGMNVADSARAYMGAGNFPTNYERTSVY